MARTINWDEPLSDEDRAWVEQRLDTMGPNGKTFQQLLDEQDGNKKPSISRDERRSELRTQIADAENELARLEVEEAEETNRNTALAGTVGDRAAGLIVRDNTAVNGETPEGASTAKEDYSDERYWTKAKLQDELRKRNDDREAADLNPLPLTGNRSELVERLLLDDDELAAERDGE
jgi:hypothetical protein